MIIGPGIGYMRIVFCFLHGKKRDEGEIRGRLRLYPLRGKREEEEEELADPGKNRGGKGSSKSDVNQPARGKCGAREELLHSYIPSSPLLSSATPAFYQQPAFQLADKLETTFLRLLRSSSFFSLPPIVPRISSSSSLPFTNLFVPDYRWLDLHPPTRER